ILLFPDAVSLDDSKIANVQTAALKQCQELQDRVTVMDVKENDALGTTFRSKVGINYLSYGTAYTPWLKVNLPKNVTYSDVKGVIKRAGVAITLDGLTSDVDIKAAISDLNKAFADVANIDAKTKLLSPPNGNLRTALNTLGAAFLAVNNDSNLKSVFGFYYSIAAQIDKFIKAASPAVLTYSTLNADVIAAVTSNFNPTFFKVVGLETETAARIPTYIATVLTPTFVEASWAGVIGAAATNLIPVAGTPEDKRQIAFNNLLPLFEEINQSYLSLIVGAATTYTKKIDESLALRFPIYKSILTGVGNSMTSMPPSGAVVGVYAATDRIRGVWKAPANISLANVISPSVIFSKTELENLNVDAVAGKSINAIRSFLGKGTLIYGARTLAGNDNEWRYISVRRFFNMVEESTKNATEAFVFEPNDANTWVKVQAMIENFLSTLWRQGALQGMKPEHAFYVAVGLGKTMTALDILEGRMIIEIGMAAVRPAEFIILRFSHKMAES
ncbi:MAG: phage tail sheath family protein, partial [Mariniphaga sp.]|nr:phage tail sheath family protein [Mariniphaga sp.]